jgi:hypothetical protein
VGGVMSPTLVQAVSLVSFTVHIQSSVQSIITVSSIAVESIKVRIEFSSPGVHPPAPSKPPPPPDHEMLPTPRPQCLARNLSKPFCLRPCRFLVILSLNNLSKVVCVGPLSWNVGIRLATSLLEKVEIGQLLRAIVCHCNRKAKVGEV